MQKCLDLAKKGFGKVSPNPLVGSVIVKENEIIGNGWHVAFGLPHAEINAISNSTCSLIGSTLYCNLEPCCHSNKKTPPCVPAIIKSGISRVVISNIDPNDKVAGKGIEELRRAGIIVDVGLLEDEGKELNKFFFKYIKTKIPYLTLKIAQTLDGKITETKGKQTWITGKESGEFVHRQRGIYDAVFIGAGTIKSDNPLLNVRNVDGRNPIKIILDGNLSVPEEAKIFNQEEPDKTWILTGKNSSKDKIKRLNENGFKVFEFSAHKDGTIDLNEILVFLGELNITSLFVEGGNQIYTQFILNNLYDEIVILQSPKIFGKGLNPVNLEQQVNLKIKSFEKLGDDLKIVYSKADVKKSN